MAANVLFLPFIRIHSPSSLFIQFNFYLPACDVPFLSFYLSVCLSVCMSVSLSACLFALPVTCPPLLLLGDEVLDLKLRSCHGQPSSFPIVAMSSPANSRTLLPMTSKADKLPLETEPVAHDNNTNWTLKPSYQTFVSPYSPDNRGMFVRPYACLV